MEPGELLLWTMAMLMLAAAGAVVVWHAQRRARVGRVVYAERPRRGARKFLLAGVLAALTVVIAGRESVALPPALAVLVLSGFVLARNPGFLDSVCGEDGVQRGWSVRRYEALEEWRIIGGHLRWKLHGEWLATRLPVERQPAVREKLARLCPERESRFNQ